MARFPAAHDRRRDERHHADEARCERDYASPSADIQGGAAKSRYVWHSAMAPIILDRSAALPVKAKGRADMPLNLVRLDDGAGRSVMSEKGTLSLDQRRATLRGLLLSAIAVTTLAPEPATLRAQSATEFVPVTDAMLKNPAPEDWLMWRRTLDGWGYSPLDQVTPENVDELRLVWSRALTAGTQESTPLAYGGVLYVPQASDVIQAIDALTGDLKWGYRRDLPDDVYEHVGGNARNNRNIAIYDRLIINTSDDSYVFALDAATGDTAWETQILDYKVNSATHSSGPIIANGKVISGRSCRPWGGPEACVITAHDARTGAELWRRRTKTARLQGGARQRSSREERPGTQD